MKPLTQDQITAAVLDGGIKVKLQPKWDSWEGTFSAPFDETTDHPVYKAYDRANIEHYPVGASKIGVCTIPCGVTFTTPIGFIHITESNLIEHLDKLHGDERPPEIIAAEMIKNIYLATFAPEHLPESWRAE